MRMKITAAAVAVLALLCLGSPAQAQNLTTISADNIQDVSGRNLAAGQLCFQATDEQNRVMSFRAGGGGQVITTPFCTPVVNGAVTNFSIPNPDETQPANIRYRVTVTPRPARPGAANNLLTYNNVYLCDIVGACDSPFTFDLDLYIPRETPIPVPSIGAGPAGPAGPAGATGAAGAAGAISTIYDDGSAQTVRPGLNLISGTNSTVTCVDNAGATRADCTIASTGGAAETPDLWDAGTTYIEGKIISYMGALYVSLADMNTNHNPTDGAWWLLNSVQVAVGASSNLTIYETVAPVSDDFDRANGGLGANYTTITGMGAPTITSNQVVGNAASYQGAYYTGASILASPQTAQITMTGGGTDNDENVAVVVHGTGNTYYEAISGNGNWTVNKVVSGSSSALSGALGSFASAGDVITLTARNTDDGDVQISFTYLSPANGNYTYNVNVLDETSPILTGSPGFYLKDSPAAIGNFTSPSVPSSAISDSTIRSDTVAQVSLGSVCYADSSGDDIFGTGRSSGSPKQTVYAAATECLVNGNPDTYTAGSGTIVVTDSSTGNSGVNMGGPEGAAGDTVGLLIRGGQDTHYDDDISTSARATNVVTLTFGSAHDYTVGQKITVYGVTGGATSFNGHFVVASTPLTTSLTYAQTGGNESATASTGNVIPKGYLKATGGIYLKGEAVNVAGHPAFMVGLNGSTSDTTRPVFHLAGTGEGYGWEHVMFKGAKPLVIGVNSNLDLTVSEVGTIAPTATHWGCTVTDSNRVQNGPCMLWGGNTQFSNLTDSHFNPLWTGFDDIVSIARSSNVVTVNKTGGDITGWTVGQQVQIADVTNTSFNGLWTITAVTDDHHFSWSQVGADTTSSAGSVSLGPDNLNRCAIRTGFLSSYDLNLMGRTLLVEGGICAQGLGGNGGNIHVQDLLIQYIGIGSIYQQPAYWCTANACPFATIGINENSDPNIQGAFVKVPIGASAAQTVVRCDSGGSTFHINVDGPATLSPGCLTSTNAARSEETVVANASPLAKGQIGIVDNRFLGQVNDHRFNLGPSYVKFLNLADEDCANWVATDGNTTITCNQTDATWNTTTAGNLSCTSGACSASVHNANLTTKPGDGFIIGTFVKSTTTAGIGTSGLGTAHIQLTPSTGDGVSCSNYGGPIYQGTTSVTTSSRAQEDGDWQWISGWCRMNATATGTAFNVNVTLHGAVGYPARFMNPMFLHVPLAATTRASSAISGVVRTLNETIVTTSAAHTFLRSQYVCIEGVTDTTFNGCFQVKRVPIPTSTTFAIANTGSNGSSSGGTVKASNDSEIAELALNLSTYPSSCSVGDLCNYAGPIVGGGGGDALVANPLSQFAATTSDQLATVLTNESGTGVFTRSISPVFTTPNIGAATGSVSGNAGTATALSANGANCGAGNYPLGVDASGAVEGCTSASAGGARFTAGGDAVVASDIVPGAGWGSTAAVSAVTGHDQAFNFTITTGGTGIAANPTFTMTFTDGTWTLSPIFACYQTGGNDVLSDITFTNGVTTATTIPGIWNGTPTTAKTYIITCIGVGR